MTDITAAKELVTRFLRLMEERDLATAESFMALDAQIIFPGGKQFGSQREMVAAARGRYKWVKKRLDQVDAFAAGDQAVVYVLGTLYGVNRYDLPFADVRYVDRFVVQNGRITRQEVWNDLAESGVLEQKQP